MRYELIEPARAKKFSKDNALSYARATLGIEKHYLPLNAEHRAARLRDIIRTIAAIDSAVKGEDFTFDVDKHATWPTRAQVRDAMNLPSLTEDRSALTIKPAAASSKRNLDDH